MANPITTLQAENLQGIQEKFLSNSQEGPWAQKLPVPPSDSKMASITPQKKTEPPKLTINCRKNILKLDHYTSG